MTSGETGEISRDGGRGGKREEGEVEGGGTWGRRCGGGRLEGRGGEVGASSGSDRHTTVSGAAGGGGAVEGAVVAAFTGVQFAVATRGGKDDGADFAAGGVGKTVVLA